MAERGPDGGQTSQKDYRKDSALLEDELCIFHQRSQSLCQRREGEGVKEGKSLVWERCRELRKTNYLGAQIYIFWAELSSGAQEWTTHFTPSNTYSFTPYGTCKTWCPACSQLNSLARTWKLPRDDKTKWNYCLLSSLGEKFRLGWGWGGGEGAYKGGGQAASSAWLSEQSSPDLVGFCYLLEIL